MKSQLVITLLVFSINILIGQNNPCANLNDYTIVVLGSSTAAGTGASTADSAWVNRYRKAIQEINPSNNVINLGVGGFTSYRIMPNNHTPPVGRPMTDTAKNISKALSFNPDAIIINLPSNDIASGFTIAEQIYNLDSIVNMAANVGVPIWVCTTQPKNMSTNNMQIQANMRDTIYSHFGTFTIDFWNTLATVNNGLSPIYDSGDGTHLNDKGHGLLAERVFNKDILSSLYTPPNQLDYAIIEIIEQSPICGDSLALVEVVLANLGAITTNNYNIDFGVTHLPTNTNITQTVSNFANLNTCEADTFLFNVNTIVAGNYLISTMVNSINDFNTGNNQNNITIQSVGHPPVTLVGDTTCTENGVVLEAIYEIGDTAFWYDSPFSNTPIGTGQLFSISNLNAPTTYYAEVVRGDLFYKNELSTTSTSNINWNGTMFDLVPQTDLTIDSFGVKINSLGNQSVDIYYKNGTHQGFEGNAAVWTFLGTTTVNVSNANSLTNVTISHLPLLANNTYGIYIQMSNSSSMLSYQSSSNPITRSNNELTIVTGSGISHNFSASYYPRDWNGSVYYHHGFRTKGDCATDLLPVIASVSNPTISIGQDTIIDIDATLIITVDGLFDSYLWFDSSTNSTITIAGSDLGSGIHYITLEAIDSLGCVAKDTLILGIADLVKTDFKEILAKEVKIFPNPFQDYFIIKSESPIEGIQLFNSQSIEVPIKNTTPIRENEWSVILNSGLPSGIYFCRIGNLVKLVVKI